MTKLRRSVGPCLVDEPNLSHAWARAMLHAIDHSGTSISPLIVSVTGFDEYGAPQETPALRDALDTLLVNEGHYDIETVAFTIFPQRLWKISQGDRAMLFSLYKDAFPRYQAMKKRENRRGLYFERMTSFGHGRCEGNQLEWILSQFHSREGVRHSMYQASIFDPERDHVPDARLLFPCLQHVSFEPTEKGLVVNAFYATQQLFVKAYGNYLGVAQLGAFVAHEMNIKLYRVNIFVGVAKFEQISKTAPNLQPLIKAARACLSVGNALAVDVEEPATDVETAT